MLVFIGQSKSLTMFGTGYMIGLTEDIISEHLIRAAFHGISNSAWNLLLLKGRLYNPQTVCLWAKVGHGAPSTTILVENRKKGFLLFSAICILNYHVSSLASVMISYCTTVNSEYLLVGGR
jgi:hypothetical protein